MSRTVNVAIVIPTYNEAENIEELVTGIKKAVIKSGATSTVLIVDDNSPDGTGRIANTLAKRERSKTFRVQVLHQAKKQGIHAAYAAGFTKLLKGDHYTHIMQMDGDLSHDPKYIPAFVKAAQRSDFIVGSRYIPGGATPDWSKQRRLLSHYGNLYARMFLGSKIHDYTGGYNMYAGVLLKEVNPNSVQASGYGFQIELKHRALMLSQSVTEIPIVFKERKRGTSKIPPYTIPSNLMLVPKRALHIRLNRHKKYAADK
jgi:dolichol-phosphate mannosyltransferase